MVAWRASMRKRWRAFRSFRLTVLDCVPPGSTLGYSKTAAPDLVLCEGCGEKEIARTS
jgi:hypothetical protein